MQYRKLSDLHKLEGNPRKIEPADMEKLVVSLRRNKDYFEARPLILSNRTGKMVIIAGNQRYEAAKILGLKEVPTHLIEDLSEDQEREIIIRDNVSNGEWDFEALQTDWNTEELKEWGVDVPDIDMVDAKEIKEVELRPFNKTHVLLSFPPELLTELEPFIEKIKNIHGVEYEQSSN